MRAAPAGVLFKLLALPNWSKAVDMMSCPLHHALHPLATAAVDQKIVQRG
jgi:hypothetical protein